MQIKFPGFYIIPLIFALIVFIFVITVIIVSFKYRKKLISEFKTLRIGMTKHKVLEIMNNRYTTSYLRDGTEKYTWTLSAGKEGNVYTIKQMAVIFEDDLVIEILNQ